MTFKCRKDLRQALSGTELAQEWLDRLVRRKRSKPHVIPITVMIPIRIIGKLKREYNFSKSLEHRSHFQLKRNEDVITLVFDDVALATASL